MRARPAAFAILLGPLLLPAPLARAQDDPTPRVRDSVERFDVARQRTVDRALRALEAGDPVDAALALSEAIESVGRHPSLVEALDAVREPAAQAAAARVTRLLDEGDAPGALSLLARLGAAVHSPELDALIDRATVAQRLEESASHEAAGRTADAMRAAVLASNASPDDPRVVAAMSRLGLRTHAAPRRGDAPADGAAPAPRGDAAARLDALERDVRALREARELAAGGADASALRALLRIDALENQVRSLEGVVERSSRALADMQSRQRLDGRAEYATDELDRRVREVERQLNGVSRYFSRLESDIRDLSRRIDRVR